MPGGPAGGAHRSKAARRKAGLSKYKPQYNTPRPRPAPAASRSRSGGGPAAWSGLILDTINRVVKPNGDVMHQVKPMEQADAEGDLLMGLINDIPKDVPKGAKSESPAARDPLLADWTNPRTEGLPDAIRAQDPAFKISQEVERNERNKPENQAASGRVRRSEMLGNDVLGEALADANILGINLGDLMGKAKPEPVSSESIKEDYKIDPLSANEYNALTPRQRAAVDVNTMLATAVQNDLARQDEYSGSAVSGAERDKYNEAVEKMFGEGRGSDLYAPETVAILQRLNINPNASGVRDESVADLDDYLGLKVAVTAKELKTALAPGTEANAGRSSILNSEALGRTEFVNKVADRGEMMAKTMAKSQELLQTFAATALNEVTGQVKSFGGSPSGAPIAPGFGAQPIDEQFRQYFAFLSDTNIKDAPEEILGFVREQHGDKGLDEFLSYADRRSLQAMEYGLDFETAPGQKHRTPREFRNRLGLGE